KRDHLSLKRVVRDSFDMCGRMAVHGTHGPDEFCAARSHGLLRLRHLGTMILSEMDMTACASAYGYNPMNGAYGSIPRTLSIAAQHLGRWSHDPDQRKFAPR